mmetsp:Transcript_4410/g.10671  ORF Transcript_4410/g.10671 Transcript_4410/m.10671 type:complete len:122 (+) Transcript_4410:3-368(+)
MNSEFQSDTIASTTDDTGHRPGARANHWNFTGRVRWQLVHYGAGGGIAEPEPEAEPDPAEPEGMERLMALVDGAEERGGFKQPGAGAGNVPSFHGAVRWRSLRSLSSESGAHGQKAWRCSE